MLLCEIRKGTGQTCAVRCIVIAQNNTGAGCKLFCDGKTVLSVVSVGNIKSRRQMLDRRMNMGHLNPSGGKIKDEAIMPEDINIDVAGNIALIKDNMKQAMAELDRTDPLPKIVAVSKRHDVGRIKAALNAGHRCFGENRVQEAQEKWPDLKQTYPDVELHLIGSLQTNKADEAVALFDVIECLDRPKLAQKLAQSMDRQGRRPRLFIQVNTGDEPQKGGVPLSDLSDFVALCRDDLGLDIAGLMCIPPKDDDPALHFALLVKLARRHGLLQLSMGMSADYDIAAAMGADYVRVGTAIFGERPSVS